MDIKSKIQEFNKRFDITDNSNYKEEFRKFKTRILNIFEIISIPEAVLLKFLQIAGIPIANHFYKLTTVVETLSKVENEQYFYRLLQELLLAYESLPEEYEIESDFSNFAEELDKAIELSNVNLALTFEGDEVILYPRGEKELDEKLVNEVLSFLNPESQKHFVDALQFYQKGTSKDAVKSAESIRRCVEEFLRFRLQNQKGLKANIEELQTKLKEDERDPQVRNVIFHTFACLDTYFNENCKHKDGDINEAENEFIIYQSGVLIRYIHKALP